MTDNEILKAMSDLLNPVIVDLSEIKSKIVVVDEKIGSLENKMDALDERVGSLENKMDVLDERVGSLENKMDALDERVGSLENKMDALDERVGSLENKMDALDERVGSLDEKVDRNYGKILEFYAYQRETNESLTEKVAYTEEKLNIFSDQTIKNMVELKRYK